MQPFQQRVVDEKTDLDGKLSRLQEFIIGTVFHNLNGLEQDRLRRQCDYMEAYSAVLAERIAAFK